jgi:protein O-mannosyl-transferase
MMRIIKKLRTTKEMRFKLIFILILISSIYLLYNQVSHFDFVSFDDPIYVKNNPTVRHGLTLEGIIWAFTGVYAANWHPLTWMTHMADVELFGINPGMHHLTNVILHVLNSIMLFFLLHGMTRTLWRSALVAALFALHPLHVESVAWISERKDVLSTFFWFLTMIGYMRYVTHRSISRYLLVAVSFGLGLMAKPMLVTLPFVLLLMDYWPLRRGDFALDSDSIRQLVQRLILEKVPLIIMAFAACAVTFYAQSLGGAVSTLERINLMSRVQNAIISYGEYLWKTIWPVSLAAFYPYPKSFSLVTLSACLIFLIAVTLVVITGMRKRPYLFTGWFWYLGTLVPVIGIIQVGSQSMADRYTYIPLVGLFIMITWGSADLLGKLHYGSLLFRALSAVILGILALLTWTQVQSWRNSETLFRHALLVTTDNYLAHNSLGVALYEKGEVDNAIWHYRESVRIRKDNVNAQCNLGVALAGKKQYIEAFQHYQECLRIKPGYSEAYYNMGVAYSELGKKEDAIRQYEAVLKNYPHHENAHNNLGFLLSQKGDIDGAIRHYLEALNTNPYNVRARINLADAWMMKGKMPDAFFQVTKALEIEPYNQDLYIKLAEIHVKASSPDQAIGAYRKALSINRKATKALYGIASIYAKQNRYDEALAMMKELSVIKPNDPSVDYNIACLYSRQGNLNESILSLKDAVNKGFRDQQMLKTDPDLENVRKTKMFTEVMNKKFY